MYRYMEIMKLLGSDSFYKGRYYPYRYISEDRMEKTREFYIHNYYVKSENSRNYYSVVIKNNGENILDYKCTCPKFEKDNTCKHVAAVLIQNIDYITEYEIIDPILISKEILKNYKKQVNNIKEKIDLDIELYDDYNEVELKLRIGKQKKYLISTTLKLNDFLYSYYNEEAYEFGKLFTYDPEKHYFDEKTQKILDYINENIYRNSSRIIVDNIQIKTIIDLMDGSVFKVNHRLIDNIHNGLPTQFILTKEDGNYKLNIDDYENYNFVLNNKYIMYNNNLFLPTKEEIKYISTLKKNKINELIFEQQELNEFSSGLFNKIKNNIKIDENINEISLPIKPNIKLYFDILYSKLKCDIIFEYKEKEINFFSKENILRDNETEYEVVNELMELGFIEENQSFIMTDEDQMYQFIDEILEQLSQKYEIFTSKKIDKTNILKTTSITNNFSIGKDGIMSYKFDVEGVDYEELNNLFSALKQKKKYYKLKNNNVVSLQENKQLEELNNLVQELNLSKNDIQSGFAQIPKYRALYIDSLKKSNYKNIKTNNLFQQFIDNFNKYKDSEIELENKDELILRDYQKEGVKWLNTIYKCDFGAILADEMGLGKSLQTIIFIKQILKEKPESKIIIVVPTSLIYNWEKEFIKFAPHLKYVVVADNKQKRKEIFKKIEKYNIFITSYGLIRNDKDEYENIDFELCVLDEAQNIKNSQAIMTREIKKIKAKCKIALTGTPLENNITELWSIFDYIMPGYLNTIVKFKEKYNISDVDEESMKTLKTLNYQITPFILRRKKIDVIKSLPEKIENKVYIDLPNKQKMLYLKVLNDTKKEMDEMISNGGFQKSRMKILQLLTKLRQICIDPSVMYDNYNGEKVKIEELIKIVQENIENGHKILIFSSFKRVLENVKKEFKKNNISNYMIDGSVKSKDRIKMVESFNSDDTNCFLITLKSGGTGLNLTGADVVIHLDIWWNPQVENQATDRAHRIGQTKKVSVIKLITNGTIEERIIELQEKKKILSDNLIEGKNGEETLSSLSEQEIRKLLSISE